MNTTTFLDVLDGNGRVLGVTLTGEFNEKLDELETETMDRHSEITKKYLAISDERERLVQNKYEGLEALLQEKKQKQSALLQEEPEMRYALIQEKLEEGKPNKLLEDKIKKINERLQILENEYDEGRRIVQEKYKEEDTPLKDEMQTLEDERKRLNFDYEKKSLYLFKSEYNKQHALRAEQQQQQQQQE